MTLLDIILEWRRAFELPTAQNPTVPTPERVNLCTNLLAEEVTELFKAVKDVQTNPGTDNFNRVIAESADTLFVLVQLLDEMGLIAHFPRGVELVQKTNMSKLITTHDDVLKSQALYKDSTVKRLKTGWLIIDREGKVRKPYAFKPLKAIINV